MSYKYLFWIDGLTCMISALVLRLFISRFKFADSQNKVKENEIYQSPWKDGIYIFILLLLLIIGMSFTQIFNTWPLYLKSFYHLLENKIGLLLALNALIITFCEMPLVHGLEKHNTIKVMGLGGFLLLFGFSLLPFGSTYFYGAITVIVCTIGEMLVFPFMAGFISNRANDNNRGKYMGMFSFTFSLGLVAGPALGTWIYETYSPQMLWYSVGIMSFLIWFGFVFLYGLLKKEKNKT